jgi:catechol 2,3-dioxygenase-like lactoylglutathione lyase family enzyme
MISGGNATVFVSDMDAAVHFYVEILGLKLRKRYGDHWATVDAGAGLTIGLHPSSPKYPAPGTNGAVMLGLETDEPIERTVAHLAEHGLKPIAPIVSGEGGRFVHFADPDGNEFYLWEVDRAAVPETPSIQTATHS